MRLGIVLKTILKKLETALDNPAYNYIIHTSPFDTQMLPHYHWHMEIIPRLTRCVSGEFGVGDGLLHQPGAAGAGGAVPARHGGGSVGEGEKMKG